MNSSQVGVPLFPSRIFIKLELRKVNWYLLSMLQPLLENSPVRVPTTHGTTKYSKLENELDSPNRQFLDDTLQQQNHIVRTQDEQLDMISDSIGTLKTVSRQIGSELDEQAVWVSDDWSFHGENRNKKENSYWRNEGISRWKAQVNTQKLKW